MKREVLPPRSWLLERIAIAAAFAALAACSIDSVPSLGKYHECAATLKCDGTTSTLTARICAVGPNTARVFFEDLAPEWLDDRGVVCNVREIVDTACEKTDETCIY